MASSSKGIREFDDIRIALKEIQEQGSSQYSHIIPQLPEWFDKEYVFTENGEVYSINLYKLTCTCNEFKEKSTLYKPGEIKSLCRHIYGKILRTRAVEYIDELSLLLLKDYMHNPELVFYSYILSGRQIIIGLARSPWINIYAKAKRTKEDSEGRYSRYSYNIKQDRWSYNISPYPKNLIIEAIKISLRQNSAPA